MARDNGYGILLDFEFESFASVNEKFEKIVDKLKKNAKIDFSTNGGDFSNITKELETLKKEFNKLQNVKINIDTTGSYTQIEQLKNDANEILNIVKKYNTEGKLISVSSSITRQNNDLVAQKDIYNKLNALQEDEFRIKTKLLNASKEETTILKSRLSLNQGLQKEGNTFLSNNNLTDEKQYNELLTRRKDLEYELSLAQAKATNKYNTNVEKERIKYQEYYVNTWKDLLNEQDKAENKLKEIQNIQLKMTQSLNVKKSQGWLNNPTYTNIQKQIDKINVDTPKSKIQDLFKTINNIDKSSSKVYELSNYINNAKETISRVKSDNSDFLNIDGSVEKIKQLEEYLKQAESMLNKLKKNSLSVDNISYKDIKNNLGSSTDEINKIEKENNAVKDLIETKTRLLEIEKSRVVRTYGDKIDTSSIDEAIKKLKSMNNQPLSNVKSEIKGIDLGLKELKESARSSESFISKMGRTLRNFGIYLDIGDVVRELGQAIKEATSYIKDMDTGMTNMQMITGKSKETIQNTVNDYKQLATQMHTTNTEMMSGMEELLRAGYDTQTSKAMMSSSIIGSKISGQSVEDVTEQLIAIKNAFNLTGEETEGVVDTISKLDNTASTSFAEIAQAIQRTAYSAQQAGTPFEKLASYITVVSEKTRKSAETIGESFKTIYARYSNIKLGNLDEDGKSINDTETAMKRIGIQIRDSKDQFRNFDDVLQEFMDKYKKGQLSQVDYLAGIQALAGTRQRETLMALCENTELLAQHQEDVANATGNAKRMFDEVYSDSLDAKINNLKNSIQNMYDNFLNSDALKTGLETLNTLIKTFGNLPMVISLCTTAFMLFKGEAIWGSILGMKEWITTLGLVETVTYGATTSLGVLSSTFAKLGGFISANPLGAIAIAVTGYITLVQSLNKEVKSTSELLEDVDTSLNKLKETESNQNTLNEYKQLKSSIQDNTLSINDRIKAKERMTEIEKEFANTYADTITGYNSENEAISTNIDAIQKKIDKEKELAKIQLKGDYSNLLGKVEGLNYNKSGFGDFVNKWLLPLFSNPLKIEGDKAFIDSITGAKTGLEEYNALIEKTKNNEVWSDKDKESWKELNESFNAINKAITNMYQNGQSIEGMEAFDFDTGKMIDANEYIKKLSFEINGSAKGVNILNEALGDTTNALETAEEKAKDLMNVFSSSIDMVNLLNEVIKNVQEYGQLDYSTVEKIFDTGNADIITKLLGSGSNEELLNNANQLLQQYNGSIQSNYQSLLAYYQAQVDGQNEVVDNNAKAYEIDSKNNANVLNDKIENTTKATVQIADKFGNNINILGDGYGIDAQNFANAQQSKVNSASQAVNQIADMYNQLNRQSTNWTDTSNPYGIENGKAQQFVDDIKKNKKKIQKEVNDNPITINSGYDKITPTYSKIGDNSSIGGNSSSVSSVDYSVDDIDLEIDLFHDEENALERLKNKYDLLDKQKSKAYGQQKVNLINQQIKLIEEEERKTNDLLSAYNRRKEELKSQLSSKGVWFDGDIISNYNEIITSQQNLANAIQSTSEESKKYKQQVQDDVNNLKSLMDEYTDLVLNDISSQQSALQDLQNQYKELQDEMVDLVAKGESDIANVIKDYAEEKYKALEEETNKRIELLEKEKQALQDSYDEDNYNDTIAEKQDNINKLEQKLQDATISGNATKIQELTDQLNEAQKDLQDTIVQNQRDKALEDYDDVIDSLNEKKEAYDKEKEDLLDNKNLTKLVQEALETGYVTIGDSLLDLTKLTNDYITNTTVGNANIKQGFDEINESIQNAYYSMKQLGNLMSNGVNFSGLFGSQSSSINYLQPLSLSSSLMSGLTKSIQPINIDLGGITVSTTDTSSLKKDLTIEFGKTIDNIVKEINNSNKGY